MTSATERFKRLLANALERVCVLEAQVEELQRDLAEADELLGKEGNRDNGTTNESAYAGSGREGRTEPTPQP